MENLEKKSLLEEMNEIINPEFTKLSGLMFTYNKQGVNTTLFVDYLGLDSSGLTNFQTFYNQAISALGSKKKTFQDFFDKFESKSYDMQAREYYLENFSKILLFFELLEKYILIEA